MDERNTIDTFYDKDKEVDIEIETLYNEGCPPTIKITAYKDGKQVCNFTADFMDRYFLDELEIDD